jgi:dihydrodipicolinate synthase/N-acetylneuraminate lyase
MMNTTRKLEGIIPALITPFTESGKIDFTLLEKQVSYLSSAGVHGFFVGGTTGEGPYLTTQEKVEVFKSVKEVSAGKQFLCAACLQLSTPLVLEEIRAFSDLEPDFVVAVTPYYYAVPQEVIISHYKEIAQNSPVPIILYNIPSCTHNPIALESIVELASVENIAGIKDSSGNFIGFTRGVYTELRDDFAWIQGEDYLDGPSLLVGAKGIVTGLGNVWIEPYVELYREKEQGNLEKLHDLQKTINKLYEVITVTEGKIIPAIKAGATLLGRSSKWMKIAGLTLHEDEIAKVKQVLVELGLV